jgi:aspartyl-tRNA(Asn)/glutamyl-tRNA(Gln) amidotransferase subunit A
MYRAADELSSNGEIALMTATELVDRFRARDLSPVAATEAVLRRIDALNDRINAFCLVDQDAALSNARASERRWVRGEPRGLLDGVPVSIKDILLTKGWPTLRGSRLVSADQDWSEDAPSVARLRAQGAVLIGKTTTPELGWKGVTDSPLYGITRNPWNIERTSGGSSGGSAAAVALGMGPLSVGTDGGGSVRIPAAFCGGFALKPTYGRIPLYPASPFGTLAHAGPMTRTVEDAALMMEVLSLPDSRDWSALPPPHESHLSELGSGVTGMRIAFSPTLGYVKVDSQVESRVRAAVDVLAELGAVVEEVDPGFDDPVEAFHVLWFTGAAKSVEQFPERSWSNLDPALREVCEQGRRMTALDYLRAVDVRMQLGVLMGRFHQIYDVLITPTLPIPAFSAGVEVPAGSPSPRWTGWTPFTYPFNLTQQPAATVPCGFTDDGLPVGLHVVGPRHAELRILRVCKAYQDARTWSGRMPPL